LTGRTTEGPHLQGVGFARLQPIKGNVLRIAIKDAGHPIARQTFDTTSYRLVFLTGATLATSWPLAPVLSTRPAGFSSGICVRLLLAA
jgi:hypothetical protein